MNADPSLFRFFKAQRSSKLKVFGDKSVFNSLSILPYIFCKSSRIRNVQIHLAFVFFGQLSKTRVSALKTGARLTFVAT